MKTMYPSQKITTLLFAMLFSGAAFAQEGNYASVSKPQTTGIYVAAKPPAAEPFIKVGGRAETKVLLHWAPVKGAVSHYVLERSTDGLRYEEAGLLFTGDWAEEPEYFYTDKFRRPYSGPLYYRLRIVGLDGSVIYTSATLLDPEHA